MQWLKCSANRNEGFLRLHKLWKLTLVLQIQLKTFVFLTSCSKFFLILPVRGSNPLKCRETEICDIEDPDCDEGKLKYPVIYKTMKKLKGTV